MAFVFLEKQPVYQCLNKDTGQWQTEGCDRAQFCDDSLKISWRVDWEASESIRNLIYQLNFYCAPDYMIGLLGACFLLGIVVGCSTLTRLGDTHGRKPIYMLGICIHLLFMVGILIVKSPIICFFLTFVFGMSVTARYYVGYTYNVEMQPKSHYVLVSTT
jgi:MFS family permease